MTYVTGASCAAVNRPDSEPGPRHTVRARGRTSYLATGHAGQLWLSTLNAGVPVSQTAFTWV